MNVYIDTTGVKPQNARQSLILSLLEKALGAQVKLVDSPKNSDLIISTPHLYKSRRNRCKFLPGLGKYVSHYDNFAAIMGYPHQRVLVLTDENLDHPINRIYRKALLKYDVPRLTFWSEELDPQGCRFPYWWNYVQYEDIELEPSFYARYGKPLSLEKLMSPFVPNHAPKDRIAVLVNHLGFPRQNQLKQLEGFRPIDVYMAPNRWNGNKHQLLSEYKYIFCPENSCGYGYETEKLPEAWDAGCIPLGYIRNPLGDFSDEIFTDSRIDLEKILTAPLVKEAPDLDSVVRYLKKVIHANCA